MKQHLDNIYALLDKANKSGAFTMQEAQIALASYSAIVVEFGKDTDPGAGKEKK